MSLMQLFGQTIPIAAVLLAGIVWLPLALRYRFRRAALGALFVILCSTSIALLYTGYIEMRRNIDPFAGVEGDWPSATVAAGLGGICDFFLPIICFGTVFSVATLIAVTTLEIRRTVNCRCLNRANASTEAMHSGDDDG
jgi:hypothetical protein